MVACCRADDVLLDVMCRPADYGIGLTNKAMHRVMVEWVRDAQAGDARRAARRARRKAAQGGGGNGSIGGSSSSSNGSSGGSGGSSGGGNGVVAEPQQRREQGGAWLDPAAAGPGPRAPAQRQAQTVARLEVVLDAMPAAGVPPTMQTWYILVRAAANAGLPDKAAAFAARAEAELGTPLRPSAARLLAGAGGGSGGGSSDS
jgi:hypothetical protein